MGFRFRKSIKIAPGVRLQVTQKGISSITIAGINFGKNETSTVIDLPGTGLHYRARLGRGLFSSKKAKKGQKAQADEADMPDLTLNEDGTLAFWDARGKPLADSLVPQVKRQHRPAIEAWLEEQCDRYNAELNSLFAIHETALAPTSRPKELLLADAEAMSEALAAALAALTWPRETLVSFDVVADGRTVLLDVDLPEIEAMPQQEARVDKRQLRLALKERTAKQRRLDYLQHIHGVGFCFVGLVFAHLPSVETAVLSAYSQRPNLQTGHVEDDYLYSARVPRSAWTALNFNNLAAIDVVACWQQFELRRKITANGHISAVEPFVE